MTTRVLTGITPTGVPHLGNYLGMIKPALSMSTHRDYTCYFFIADYHSLIKLQDPAMRQQATLEVAATWLALGLDVEKSFFYRQSDIPEILELTWILNTVASKGLLNRAHAYKSKLAENSGAKDPDAGIVAGLYQYPILMAADILIFNAEWVPVGKDQIQHIEIARDIALRFNHIYGDAFILPQAKVDEAVQVLPGLDGRKMSKSYGNTIPLFSDPKQLKKRINKIQTNSQLPHEPKDPDSSLLFDLYGSFASEHESKDLAQKFSAGIGWGDVKAILYEKINSKIESARDRYFDLIVKPDEILSVLEMGRQRVRPQAQELLDRVRELVGI